MSFSPSELPTKAQLDAARHLSVQDERGDEVPFSSLVDGDKVIVIFIRHFFCGLVRLCHLSVYRWCGTQSES